MELFTEVIKKLWEGFGTITVPIINMTMDKFLLAVLVLGTLVTVVNITLGKEGGDK